MSPRLSFVLDNWLDPDPDRRTLSAIKAAAVLREKIVLPSETRTSIDAKTEATSAENNQNGAGPSWSGAFPRDSFLGEILHNLEERTEQRVYPSELPSNSQLIIQDLAPGLYIKIPKEAIAACEGALSFLSHGWVLFFLDHDDLAHACAILLPLFSIPFWICWFFDDQSPNRTLDDRD